MQDQDRFDTIYNAVMKIQGYVTPTQQDLFDIEEVQQNQFEALDLN